MKRIRVALGPRSYDICIAGGLIRTCAGAIAALGLGGDAVIITNTRLARLYGTALRSSLQRRGLSVRIVTVPDSERAKSITVATSVLSKIAAYDVRRRVFIIALGGGVVGDLAGFVAATYKRGIPYVQIPTTLLAQVDSAIGGKVAIDLKLAKNLAGAFYQPRIVISDTSVLRTLPGRQVKSGLAEVIKYGAIRDPKLFAFLEKNMGRVLRLNTASLEYIISRSAAIKASVVSRDEYDRKGERAILNLGHTIGHAIEAACGYSGRYSHGEAVAIGIVAASRIAKRLGLLKQAEACRIEALIRKAGLPVAARGVRFSEVYKAHLHDKKFVRGTNRFVLPVAIGKVRIVEAVPDTVVRDAIKGCIA